MNRTMRSCLPLVGMVLVLGCQDGSKKSTKPTATGMPDKATVLAKDEPAGKKSVLELRDQAKKGDAVVLVAQIGGKEDPFHESLASFWAVDMSFPPCGDTGEEDCDFCNIEPAKLKKGTISVKIVDKDGKVHKANARDWLGLKPLDVVVVQGSLERTADDDLILSAQSLHVQPRSEKKGKGK